MHRLYFLIAVFFCIPDVFAQRAGFPGVRADTAAAAAKKAWLSQAEMKGKGSPVNVILIVADDLGKHDLSVYGNLLIETQHIDRMAREGALFSDGYSTASVCSPSRAGLLTGRYQQRFGYHMQPHQRYPRNRTEWWLFKNLVNTGDMEPASYGVYPSAKQVPALGLPASELALSEVFRHQGYATAWIGKWHLGYAEPMLPVNFGFDYSYGFYEAFSLFADPHDPAIVNARINEFTDKHIWRGARKGPCAIRENGVLIDEKEYITYAFFRKAEEFIKKHREQPFFVYLPLSAPHTPYQAPRDIYNELGHIQNHNKRVYYAMILAMDRALGRMLEVLEEEGLDRNTLIVFTSDNGAALYSRTVDNKPLNGGKMTLFEGGINVPFIMYHKGQIAPGTLVKHAVNHCDIFATLSEVAGARLPQDRIFDGVSLLPWVSAGRMQEPQQPPHQALYWMADYNLAIRTAHFKLIVNTLDKTAELYQLQNDPGESTDVSGQYPQQMAELQHMLSEWAALMPPAAWPAIMDYRVTINGKLYRWAV